MNKYIYAKLVWRFAKKYTGSFINYILINIINNVLYLTMPILIAMLIDEVIYYKNISFFWKIAAIYAICMIGLIYLRIVVMTVWQYIANRFVADIRIKIYEGVMYAKAAFLSDIKTGDIMSRINWDTLEVMNFVTQSLSSIIVGAIRLIFVSGFIFFYSWQAGLLMLVIIPISTLISRHFGQQARNQSRAARKAYGAYVSWLFELLKGLREIKLMAAEKSASINFVKSYKEMLVIKIKSAVIQFKSSQLMGALNIAMQAGIFIIAAYLAYNGNITVGAVVVLLEYFNIANSSMTNIINNIMDIQIKKSAADRLIEILGLDKDKDETRKDDLVINKGIIDFKNVSFSYENRNSVLNDICLRIGSGEHVSIVGASGAGKSTLAYLLTRFYTPDSGSISVDEININECSLKSVRKNIGVVQQDSLIFRGTVRMNLTLGNNENSDDEIMKACDMASIGDYIRKLPQGLDTEIGKGAIEMSGGQKQRLSIARIYLKDPKVLIFDEATSSLDYQSEKEVHKAWDTISRGKTTITIAHRLTTILKSDRVAVLENGEIVSFDNHKILIDACPVYQRLFKEQYIGQKADDND